MKKLSNWFFAVGIFYILLGIGFFPPINEARLPLMIPVEVGAETIAYKAIVDWTFFFGLDIPVIGAYLLTNLAMESAGWVVGAPGAAERATRLVVQSGRCRRGRRRPGIEDRSWKPVRPGNPECIG